MFNFSDQTHPPIDVAIVLSELENNFPYFKTLDSPLKQRFLQRLSYYLREKNFVSRQGLVMTPQIRILISACAVQITFGLEGYTLDTFETIVVYPDVYESPVTGKMHKGETNISGFMCFSWKHVLEGIKNPDDNYNLGIHEWMHALRFNGINYKETDYFFDGYINKWVAGAMPEYNKLRAGKKSIFRRYGAANIHEFLSVCTEHFFESPDEFKREAPEFFDEMCVLLNQAPSKTGPTIFGIRNALMQTAERPIKFENPVITLEASFWRTLGNFSFGLLYISIAVAVLIAANNLFAYAILAMLMSALVFKMNAMYFTVKFYDQHVHIQKGFFYSSAMEIAYRSLTKMEIYHGNFDNYTIATVFQFNYYNGTRFLKKTAHCSAKDFSSHQLMEFMQKKKVNILLP